MLSGTIPIGAIYASQGHAADDPPAQLIAIGEINQYVKNLGLNVTFTLLGENAGGSATTALQNIQTLAAKGVQVIIGPNYSGQAAAILSYANSHHIVLISDGSTAPSLAIPNDYLFRLAVPDSVEGDALLQVLRGLGIKALVLLQRDDTWGDGNAQYVTGHWKNPGEEVVTDIKYATTATEFSLEITSLDSAVRQATAKYKADEVAVVNWSFDEIATLMKESASYPSLQSVLWAGSDGWGVSGRLLQQIPANTLIQFKHLNMMLGLANTTKYMSFAAAYRNATGNIPGAYVTNCYDATWIAALAILQAGRYDGAVIQKVLIGVANSYFGASGWTQLDANGDRSGGTFVLWTTVANGPNSATWVIAGSYDSSTGKASWYLNPANF
jgi:branched-chain amino acid transport system substrate-binding protein